MCEVGNVYRRDDSCGHLGRTLVTLFSMIFLLLHLAWWLALIAIVVPFPAFIASSRYGWRGYQLMRRQSPERRQMLYFTNVMTIDDFNKEIKLFNLGDFFIKQYRRLADRILVLENGKIIETGPHQELIALNGRYAELFNLQAEAYR